MSLAGDDQSRAVVIQIDTMKKSAATEGVLCACAGLTHEEARMRLAEAPGQDFEGFLTRARAGSECTACMLDLEYFFVNAPRPTGSGATAAPRREHAPRASFKQRVYRTIDRITPRVALNATNLTPVLYGAGVEQYLIVSNFPLLYEDADGLSDMRVRYTLRHGDGGIVRRGRENVQVGQILRLNLSEQLPASDQLALGSLSVDMFARRPGVRGTTRPQIELTTASAASSLHFQAPQPLNDRTFTTYYRPGEDRTFFSLVNGSNVPARAAVAYRHQSSGNVIAERTVDLAPHASRLEELAFGDGAPVKAGDPLVMTFSGEGLVRLHVICADRALSRVSIDHI